MTPKQQRFVEEYLIDLSAAAAYRRAGFLARGNSAEVNAIRLLRKAQVQVALAAAQTARAERMRRVADDVLIDIRRRGSLAEEAGQYSAALKASELEGRHMGMFTDRLKIADTPSIGAIRLIPMTAAPLAGLSGDEVAPLEFGRDD